MEGGICSHLQRMESCDYRPVFCTSVQFVRIENDVRSHNTIGVPANFSESVSDADMIGRRLKMNSSFLAIYSSELLISVKDIDMK